MATKPSIRPGYAGEGGPASGGSSAGGGAYQQKKPQQQQPYVAPKYVPPRYDNRYVLDITVAAALLLIGSFLLALYEAFVLFLDYENSADSNTLACDGVVLASSGLLLLGAFIFMYISYPEELRYELHVIESFKSDNGPRHSFAQRYLWGSSLLVVMWIFVLATLPLFAVPPLKYLAGSIDLAYCIVYELIIAAGTVVLVFWLVATFPENMSSNEGRGSSWFYDTFLACCPISQCCGDDNFLKQHAGSDFLVGSWFFFGGAGIFFAVVVYYCYIQYQYLLIYCALLGAIAIWIGSALLVWCSYPGTFYSRMWWCLMTCQNGEVWVAEEDLNERDERRRLV